jgi:tetratricopeptide (TPR) repeat protein
MAGTSTSLARPRHGGQPNPPLWDVQGIFDDALRHHMAGRIGDAVAQYQLALSLRPDFADAHNNLGVALAAQGRIDDAVAHYERALVLKPDCADAHGNLGAVLAAKGRIADAVIHCERALLLNPGHVGIHYNLAVALAAQGRIADATAHYRRALVLKPDYADAHNNLGNCLWTQGHSDEALAHYARALAINPDHAEAHNNLGNLFLERGKFDEAMAHYSRAIAIKPANTEAHCPRAEIKTFHRTDSDLAALEELAVRDDLPIVKAPFIHFALAKALGDCGDYPRAFEHLRKGNALKRSQIHYDEPAVVEGLQHISAIFNRRLMARFQGEGDPSSVPVFVLGMPRSGSTLIEQILASHPQVHGAGELTDLEGALQTVLRASGRADSYPNCVPDLDGATLRRIGQDYLARLPVLAEGKVRIIDKLPANFLNVGLIRLILPNARIIHTVRDPMDTCVSCYSKLFTSGLHFSYDLAELGRYYRSYRELMTHWRSVLPPGAMLDVAYEDVVDDLEGQARRMIDYCGLAWDDRCLDFHRNSRPVKTSSAVQVRRPLFRSSLQRWRNYETSLGPLLRALGDIAARPLLNS